MSVFSARLKELRYAKHLKQKDVADGSDITVRAYQYYESGKQEPSLVKLKNLAVFFNVSIDYLVGLTDNSEKDNNISHIKTQYSDNALDIATKYDTVTPEFQRRITRYVSGEYDDWHQASANK